MTFHSLAAFAVVGAPLTLASTTPLPDVTGGDFDHFAVDLARSRLYVAAEKYGSIEIFDLPDGHHIESIRSVAVSPRKIVLTRDGAELLIADAGTASLVVAKTTDFAIEKQIRLTPQPDSGVVDERTGIFYIGNGGVKSDEQTSNITMVSMADRTVVGTIKVPAGQVKAMAIDDGGRRLFVNFRDRNEVGVVNLGTHTLNAIWQVPGPSRNSAMAFDTQTNRLFIGSRQPGKLFVLDAANGKFLQSLNITDVSDEMAIDMDHHRLYVAGAGGLDVIVKSADGRYRVMQHLDTAGGKTFAYVPKLNRLYVVHTKGPQAAQAALQIFDVR